MDFLINEKEIAVVLAEVLAEVKNTKNPHRVAEKAGA